MLAPRSSSNSRRPPSTPRRRPEQPRAALLEPLEAQRVAEPPDTRRDRLGRELLCRVRQRRDRLVEEPDRDEPLERVGAARAPADPRDPARRQVDGPTCLSRSSVTWPPDWAEPTTRTAPAESCGRVPVCDRVELLDPVGQVRGERRVRGSPWAPDATTTSARLDGLRVRAAQAAPRTCRRGEPPGSSPRPRSGPGGRPSARRSSRWAIHASRARKPSDGPGSCPPGRRAHPGLACSA